jgi:hypothetical protein
MRAAVLLAIGLVVLYALALGNVYRPGAYDSTDYMAGAKSIACDFSYRNDNFTHRPYITGFPPLTSLLLAPTTLFSHDVLAAKIVQLLVVGAALLVLWLAFRRRLGDRLALVVPLVVGLLPEAYVWGTTVSSEWLFILTSYAFLAVARRLRASEAESATWSQVLGAAALAAAAVGSRWVGAGLVVAAAAQVLWDAGASRSLRAALLHPLTRVVVLAAVPIGLLFLRTWRLTHQGLAQASGYTYGRVATVGADGALAAFQALANVFVSAERIARFVPAARLPLYVVAVLLGLVALRGLLLRLRERNLVRDVYSFVTIALLAVVEWKDLRYWLPLAPLLVFYFVTGADDIGRRLRVPRLLPRAALAGFVACGLAVIGVQLARGDGDTYGGTLAGLHRTAVDLYRGPWRDVAVVAEEIERRLEPGEVFAILGGQDKFVAALSRRRALELRRDTPPAQAAGAEVLVWDRRQEGEVPPAWLEAYPVPIREQGHLVMRARASSS